jgi:N-acetylglutamate synthase-like GNAT family acetyltransferase
MPITLRRATQFDALAIRTIIRRANINPMGLNWERFLLAEDSGRIVGTGQIKPHGDGTRELASIAVLPEYQRQGIAADIIRALLSDEPGALYLMCQQRMSSYYARFGFRLVAHEDLPPYFRGMMRTVGRLSRVIAFIIRKPAYLVVMRRDA